MKTAVGGRVVFSLAGRAEREPLHGGVRAVIGNIANDRVARSAVRTVGERVTEAAVCRIECLAKTVRAGGEVGRNGDAPRSEIDARRDDEFLEADEWKR